MKKQLPQLGFLKGIVIPTTKQKKCSMCSKDYGPKLVEAQCKRCKRSVCPTCLSQKLTIQTGNAKEIQKICLPCKDENESMKKFVESKKLEFLKDTIAIEWLEQYGCTKEVALQNYQTSMASNEDSEEFQKMQTQIANVFGELQNAYNHSMKEYLQQVIKNVDEIQINQAIQRVLTAFLKGNQTICYQHDQVMIAMFLLTIGSEECAYQLMVILYNEMVQINQKGQKQEYNGEIDKIIQFAISQQKLTDINQIKMFLKGKVHRYISCLSINLLQVESTFFILNQMFKNPESSFDEFLRCLAVLITTNLLEFKSSSLEEIECNLFRNNKLTSMQTSYSKLPSNSNQQQFERKGLAAKSLIVNNTTNSNNNNDELIESNNKLISENKDLKNIIADLTNQLNSPDKKVVKIVRAQQLDAELQDKLKEYIHQDNNTELLELRQQTLHYRQDDEFEKPIYVMDKYIIHLEMEYLKLKNQLKEIPKQDAKEIETYDQRFFEQQETIAQLNQQLSEQQDKISQLSSQFEKQLEKQNQKNKLLLNEHEQIIAKLNSQLKNQKQEAKNEQDNQLQIQKLMESEMLRKEQFKKIIDSVPKLNQSQVHTYKESKNFDEPADICDLLEVRNYQIIWFKMVLTEKQNLLSTFIELMEQLRQVVMQ